MDTRTLLNAPLHVATLKRRYGKAQQETSQGTVAELLRSYQDDLEREKDDFANKGLTESEVDCMLKSLQDFHAFQASNAKFGYCGALGTGFGPFFCTRRGLVHAIIFNYAGNVFQLIPGKSGMASPQILFRDKVGTRWGPELGYALLLRSTPRQGGNSAYEH